MKKVAVIENKQKDYIIDAFDRHMDGEYEISCFAYWQPKSESNDRYPVKSISDIENENYDILLIAVKENRYLSRLLTYLHDKNLTRIYVVRLYAMDKKLDFLADIDSCIDPIPEGEEKPYLVHLETHVCDHCNLNCKACNNFAPFVKEPRYADLNKFENDLEKLKNLFPSIGRFFLLGGEPLLALELCCEMIETYRKYYPVNELRVLTNATLILSMKEEFWNCIRENNVIIHISIYPPVKPQIQEIEHKLIEEKVKYLVFQEVTYFVKHWTKYPFEDDVYNNNICGSAGCHYLKNGKISKCPDAMLIENMDADLRTQNDIDLKSSSTAWEVIRSLDNPIDLCKKCSYRRRELIKWEQVSSEAEIKDWEIKHYYEFENEKLNRNIEELEKKNTDLKKKIDKINSENADLKKEISGLNREKEEINEKLSTCEKKIIDIHKKNDEAVAKLKKEQEKLLSDLNNSYRQKNYFEEELSRLEGLYSYKIGRMITYPIRKIRRAINKSKKKLRETGIYMIADRYKNVVLQGYKDYKKIVIRYGKDVVLLHTAWWGTGDYYICGMYLPTWCKQNNIINFRFLVPPSGGERRVVELFPLFEEHAEYVANPTNMIVCNCFLNNHNAYLYYFHHDSMHPFNHSIPVSRGALKGYHGLNMVDFYLAYGFRLEDNAEKSKPYFNEENIDEIFVKNRLIAGKTVLLSPYSTGLKEFQMREEFWVELAKRLVNQGFIVCTNCFENENCIKGTKPMAISYRDIVPFLNRAGHFIGVRSGLCDIISLSNCKKIVIHLFKARWWDDGQSIPYTGLNNMGLCDDAYEIEYTNDSDKDKIIRNIIKEI